MKIYNNWKEFVITFDNKEYTIPKWESDCDQDLFYHIQASSEQLELNVSKEPLKKVKEEVVEEEVPSDEQIQEELKNKRKGKK